MEINSCRQKRPLCRQNSSCADKWHTEPMPYPPFSVPATDLTNICGAEFQRCVWVKGEEHNLIFTRLIAEA
ncbi:hypothetical phage protein [Salmonella bongori NCTC 12419]|uniref:Hypothetical phage protein n=1 Tax=Salmonella bongori (strain ATCC 43975 / DSM 13772 / NCTC 12419) TaxID=218493 RepID=A0A0K0HCV2_SALBC|nr:hypothetical phage protein [Salmonella bongori NCTC 12419]